LLLKGLELGLQRSNQGTKLLELGTELNRLLYKAGVNLHNGLIYVLGGRNRRGRGNRSRRSRNRNSRDRGNRLSGLLGLLHLLDLGGNLLNNRGDNNRGRGNNFSNRGRGGSLGFGLLWHIIHFIYTFFLSSLTHKNIILQFLLIFKIWVALVFIFS
jgi:hypothetical protein